MTYGDFSVDVQNALRVSSPEAQKLIKLETNNAILSFCRKNEWNKIIVKDTITLDGSEEYTLDDTILTYNFLTEIALLSDSGDEYGKYNYRKYLQFDSKDECYSILGEKLIVTGDSGDLIFMYSTTGKSTQYPVSDNGDEPLPLKHYSDVIFYMVTSSMLDRMEDFKEADRNRGILNGLLSELYKNENRANNNGQFKMIVRNSGRDNTL